jgi:protein-S-isoprenylcysteine O-methyltransferase Ste14
VPEGSGLPSGARSPAGAAPDRRDRRLLDLAEQITAVILYILLVLRLWPNELSAEDWATVLLLASEGLVLLLLIIRRPTVQISSNISDWAIAFVATFLVLLVRKGGEPLLPAIGGLVCLVGFSTHVWAKFSLGRSFGLVAAARGVKRCGPYALVRHPMYAGYFLTHIGFLLTTPSLWNLAVYLFAWPLFVVRIVAEERVLGVDPDYRAYKARVRFRLLPGVF